MRDEFWPPSDWFTSFDLSKQITDGHAPCTGACLCDDARPARHFSQGDQAHFFYEFEVRKELEVPSGGIEFHDATGRVIHGKNSLQSETPVPSLVPAGSRLRFHQVVSLDVGPGEYFFTVGLASTNSSSYLEYRKGLIPHEEFAQHVHEHCRAMDVGSFMVGPSKNGKLLHHGIANLPGKFQVNIVESGDRAESDGEATSQEKDSCPTIIHITHWKAGSQWIHKILRECVPDRIVRPLPGEIQFRHWPVQAGKLYPTVYVTRHEFSQVRLPPNHRHFVIIRDLRDSLVSAYFSMKNSHPILDPVQFRLREKLRDFSLDDALIYMMDEWLLPCAKIQWSWLEA